MPCDQNVVRTLRGEYSARESDGMSSPPDWRGSRYVSANVGDHRDSMNPRCILRSHPCRSELCIQMGLKSVFLQTEVCRNQT